MREKTTIRDIAEAACVSESTVSRILNNKGKYAQETIEAVLKAAEEKKYTSCHSSVKQKPGKSKLVGIMIPSVENEFFGSLSQRIAGELVRKNLVPVLCVTGDHPEREQAYEEQFEEIGVAGLVYLMRENDIASGLKEVPSVFVGSIPANIPGTAFCST